jgi:hypothetical protein
LQSKLAEPGIKIEGAALRTRESMRICLEYPALHTFGVQNAGKGQSAWACSDDRDTWYGHGKALFQ